jgi:hypothetical protein
VIFGPDVLLDHPLSGSDNHHAAPAGNPTTA